MTPDAALELSIEQLINALNKKLFMECSRVHSEMQPMSRALVTTLSAEVRRRSQWLRGPQVLTIYFTGRWSRTKSQRRSTRSDYPEEFTATCESYASRSPHILRHLRLRHRSKADRNLDPRLSILAQIHRFKSQELDVHNNRVETIGTSVS